jgi:fumarate reductase subunit C
MKVRTQVWLFAANRISAAILALFIVVHLATIIYAVRNGLTAAEILQRTSGSAAWAIFYGVFVLAVAVHAPIGLRNVLTETFGWRGRAYEIAMALAGVFIALWGWRAVYAVVAA